jgi:uncharacterized protein YbjT (DUF2867 family)
MNLVAGATGFLGGAICRSLLEQGRPVRALVRRTSDPAKVDNLRQTGAEIVEGDLKDRQSLATACQGATAVISTVATTISRQPDDSLTAVDFEGQKSLIDAAVQAGAQHFVYISVMSQMPDDSAFIRMRRGVEQHLRQSGLTHTILCPANFMEIWLSPFLGFDYPNANARLFGAGSGKLSWISVFDVAQFVVAALDNPAAQNMTLDLSADWQSPLEIVRTFEELGGRPFTIEHIPDEVMQQQAAAPDEYTQALGHLMLLTACGEREAINMQQTLQAFPLQLTSIRDFAGRVLAAAA